MKESQGQEPLLEAEDLSSQNLHEKEFAGSCPGFAALDRFYHFIIQLLFSSLTRRIVILNLAALIALVSGILYFGDFREGLVVAKIDSLRTQGKIIAGAIAASAIVNTHSILIDPQKLLELQAQENSKAHFKQDQEWDFPIDPERVAPLFRLVVSPNTTRARLYDPDANLLLDSMELYPSGEVRSYDLPPLPGAEPDSWTAFYHSMMDKLQQKHIFANNTTIEDEMQIAQHLRSSLGGLQNAWRTYDREGHLIVYVAVPIQRYREVAGFLLLSTIGGNIDQAIAAEHRAILKVFAVVALVLVILSLFLAYTIANPLRKLSEAADYIRYGMNKRIKIPDYSSREDEVGHLSSSIYAMTEAFYNRLDAIERFAADVSHELKNPLTSLRSAVETLPLAKDVVSKKRLLDIIQHDIQRLNRLITDISDASRLDAALAREDLIPLDLEQLLQKLISATQEVWRDKLNIRLNLDVAPCEEPYAYWVAGHDLRLEQVISNLIENARSFVSQEEGIIEVRLWRKGDKIFTEVEDNGPGIAAKNIKRIFERFYTDRPHADSFGQNSGLGLSISAQIVVAHGGELTAKNVMDPKDPSACKGACFTMILPCLKKNRWPEKR